ncbi:hypothetical protein EXIGLDRAFT_155638 [Exidia glandulosa HHB12029]|uniref:Uncharacterized protein n=1 Tax=Exidia glandulosa HHB12029 TaxID=1314781 RepID=A0A165QIX8_EXIGL|nr:hypothetical protein EXIGLDRAFT_155638 [Exidia glandulosa HHB12029]
MPNGHSIFQHSPLSPVRCEEEKKADRLPLRPHTVSTGPNCTITASYPHDGPARRHDAGPYPWYVRTGVLAFARKSSVRLVARMSVALKSSARAPLIAPMPVPARCSECVPQPVFPPATSQRPGSRYDTARSQCVARTSARRPSVPAIASGLSGSPARHPAVSRPIQERGL